MGSKNRIFLGFVTSMILHHLRNTFDRTIYMSKRVAVKIKLKHTDCFCYTNRLSFSLLLENTILFLPYEKTSDTFNFIAYMPESHAFILYALKSEKHHTNCITIFKLRESTLKKYLKQDNFRVISSEGKIILEEYIN